MVHFAFFLEQVPGGMVRTTGETSRRLAASEPERVQRWASTRTLAAVRKKKVFADLQYGLFFSVRKDLQVNFDVNYSRQQRTYRI